MEASHKTHRPHIKVGKVAEEEEDLMLNINSNTSSILLSLPNIGHGFNLSRMLLSIVPPEVWLTLGIPPASLMQSSRSLASLVHFSRHSVGLVHQNFCNLMSNSRTVGI